MMPLESCGRATQRRGSGPSGGGKSKKRTTKPQHFVRLSEKTLFRFQILLQLHTFPAARNVRPQRHAQMQHAASNGAA
jgi:hypothetical protein